MENLMRNDGRLSAMFETKVAAMARSLIDQFAINFINDSKNGRDYNEVYKQAPLHKVQQKLDPPRLDESGTAALVDSAESARAKRKARLSTAMKGKVSSPCQRHSTNYRRSLGERRNEFCNS